MFSKDLGPDCAENFDKHQKILNYLGFIKQLKETSSLSFSQPHPFSQGVLNALSKYAPELNRGRVRSNKLTGKASGASHSQLISPKQRQLIRSKQEKFSILPFDIQV